MAEPPAHGAVRPGPSGGLSHVAAVRHGEARLPAIVAVAAAGAMHAALPHTLLLEPRWVIPAVEALLLIAITLVNPRRLTRENLWSRASSIALAVVIIVTNTISLAYLLRELTAAHPTSGRELLIAALQVWVTNMIAFALVFWELDRGGAVARLPWSGVEQRHADFWFPQDEPDIAAMALGRTDERWMPVFIDYLFLSITNSVAFSPTDTMPLTSRAKLLMSVEAIAAMVTSLLVIARAVNILR